MYGFLNRVFSASKNGSWLLPRRLCEGRRYAFTVQVVESERVARKRNSRAPPKTLERIQSGRQVELQTAKVDEDVGVKVASAELSRASEDELRKARRKKLREMISQGRIAAEEEVEQGVKVPIDEDKGKEKEEMQERIPLRVSNIRRKFRGDPYEDPNEDLPVYPRRKKLESRARAIMQRLEKIESLGMINSKRAKVVEKLSYMQAGDVIRLEIKNYQGAGSQFFSGVLIAKKRNGLRCTFILRNTVRDLAVERGFHLYSPFLINAEITSHKKVRRNKLYYLREAPLALSNVGNAFAKSATASSSNTKKTK